MLLHRPAEIPKICVSVVLDKERGTVYAIIEDRGKQYKVTEGQTMDIDRIDLPDGQDTVEFDRVLLLGEGSASKIGTPTVDGAKVTATVRGDIKGPKIDVVHFIRRKGHLTRQGHRQKYTRIKIEKIEA